MLERKASIVAALAMCSLSGCYDRVSVPPAELTHLDGYDIHNESSYHSGGRHAYNFIVTDRPYRVVADDGRPIDFNSQTEMYLQLQDGRTVGGHYLAVRADDLSFRARTLDGELSVPMAQIARVEAKRPSPGKTIGLTLGIGLGVAMAAIGGAVGVIYATRRSVP